MIVVGAGTVDVNYRGPMGVVLFNYGPADFVVEAGDTARGGGGFRSTGLTEDGEEEGPEKNVQKRALLPTCSGDSGGGELVGSTLLP